MGEVLFCILRGQVKQGLIKKENYGETRQIETIIFFFSDQGKTHQVLNIPATLHFHISFPCLKQRSVLSDKEQGTWKGLDNLLTDRHLLTGRSKAKRKMPAKAFDREQSRDSIGFLYFFKCKVSMHLMWKSSSQV